MPNGLLLKDSFKQDSGLWTDVTTDMTVTWEKKLKVLKKGSDSGDQSTSGTYLTTGFTGEAGMRFILEFGTFNFTGITGTGLRVGLVPAAGISGWSGAICFNFLGLNAGGPNTEGPNGWTNSGEANTLDYQDTPTLHTITPTKLTQEEFHQVEFRIKSNSRVQMAFDEEDCGESTKLNLVGQPVHLFLRMGYQGFKTKLDNFEIRG